MGKVYAVFVSFFFCCFCFFSYANAEKCVLFKDGKKASVLKKVIVSDGNIYLQSREAAKRIGGKIDFLAASGKAVFKTKKLQAVFFEVSDEVSTNGKNEKFNNPIIVKSGLPYISAEYFASVAFSQAFGQKIEFDCGGKKIPPQTASAGNGAAVKTSVPEKAGKKEIAAKMAIIGIVYGSHPGFSRIVLDLSAPIDPNNIEQAGYDGNSYTLNIKGVSSASKKVTGSLGREASGTELSLSGGTAELKINLGETAGRVEWEQMDKNEEAGRPYRLKLDVFSLEPGETRQQIIEADEKSADEMTEEAQEEKKEAAEQAEKAEQAAAEEAADADYSNVKVLISDAQKEGKKVIIIDAGHGGRDSGTSFEVKKKTGAKAVVVYKSKGKNPVAYSALASCTKKHGKNGCVKSKKYENIYKTVSVVREKNITLEQSLELKKLFEKDKRFKVIMTRESDIELCKKGTKDYKQCKSEDLRRRNEIALENNADVFVSMHINSAGTSQMKSDGSCPSVSGFEILYRSKKKDVPKGADPIAMLMDLDNQDKAIGESRALAEIIDQELAKSASHTNIKRCKNPYPDIQSGKTDFILRSARFPAVIVESGYLCNANDRKNLQDQKARQKIVESVYKGVINYGKQKGWPKF